MAGRRWCWRTAAPTTAARRTGTSSSRTARTTRRCTSTASASPRAATSLLRRLPAHAGARRAAAGADQARPRACRARTHRLRAPAAGTAAGHPRGAAARGRGGLCRCGPGLRLHPRPRGTLGHRCPAHGHRRLLCRWVRRGVFGLRAGPACGRRDRPVGRMDPEDADYYVHAGRGMPPALLFSGEHDLPSIPPRVGALAAAAMRAGLGLRHYLVPGKPHFYDRNSTVVLQAATLAGGEGCGTVEAAIEQFPRTDAAPPGRRRGTSRRGLRPGLEPARHRCADVLHGRRVRVPHVERPGGVGHAPRRAKRSARRVSERLGRCP